MRDVHFARAPRSGRVPNARPPRSTARADRGLVRTRYSCASSSLGAGDISDASRVPASDTLALIGTATSHLSRGSPRVAQLHSRQLATIDVPILAILARIATLLAL